jgi:sigma-B regulation protein RsbU (phosphoserine phosphatase)
MKNRRLLTIRESLASRITLWVVLYVVVVLGISAYIGNSFVLRIIRGIEENGILNTIGMRKLSVALTMLFVVTLVVLTSLLRRAIHRLVAPLTTFTQAVDAVAQGNLQAELPEIHSKDEMQRLHHSFSMMQQSLARQMEELKEVNAAKGRIEGELKVAQDIQLSMLPKAYASAADSRLDICGSLTPAREVGGDLYDFIERDGKLFFCIGDVSGKGVPAALVMATTLCQFRIAASHVDDMGKIVRFINRAVCEGNETMMFVTFFAGVLDLTTGRLQCVNAGHNKPVIIDNGQLIIDNSADPRDAEAKNCQLSIINYQFLDAKPNLPLGVEEDTPYAVHEFDLPSDATLFLYTDGLTEAMTAQREQFGSQRLIDSLMPGVSCDEQIAAMTQAVHDFVAGAPQSDDLTMLAIRYNNQ